MKRIQDSTLFKALMRLVQHVPFRQAPFVYVALGDSTVEGVGASQLSRTYASLIYADLSLSFKGATHYNLGKSGARASDVLEGQLQQAIAVNPDLITLSVGANDILRHSSLGAFRRNLTHIVESLRANTHAIIAITNIPNFSLLRVIPPPMKPLAKLRIQRFNAAVLRIAKKYDLVHVDAYRQTTVFVRQFPGEVIYKDGFHPSDFGYALWANAILMALHDKLELLKRSGRIQRPHTAS
jgi:lysophospholipase L1-like esterase